MNAKIQGLFIICSSLQSDWPVIYWFCNFLYECRKIGDDDDDFLDVEPIEEDTENAQPLSMSQQKLTEERTSMLVAHFLFSIVWSVGAVLDGPSRLKFDDFFKGLCEMEGANAKYPK